MKNLKEIAEQIILLEQECQQGINISENLIKMEKVMENLSLEELLLIDEKILDKLKIFWYNKYIKWKSITYNYYKNILFKGEQKNGNVRKNSKGIRLLKRN